MYTRRVDEINWVLLKCIGLGYMYVPDAQLLQRDGAAGCVIVFAKSGKLELEDNVLRTL